MLFVIGKIFIVPIKWILKVVFNSVLGALFIWIINLIGGMWRFHIGLNLYTSVLVRDIGNTWGNFFDLFKINYGIKLNGALNMMGSDGWIIFLKRYCVRESKKYGFVH